VRAHRVVSRKSSWRKVGEAGMIGVFRIRGWS
jgi:hypothetical protein